MDLLYKCVNYFVLHQLFFGLAVKLNKYRSMTTEYQKLRQQVQERLELLEKLINISKKLIGKNHQLLDEIKKAENSSPDFWKVEVFKRRLRVTRILFAKVEIKKKKIIQEIEEIKRAGLPNQSN